MENTEKLDENNVTNYVQHDELEATIRELEHRVQRVLDETKEMHRVGMKLKTMRSNDKIDWKIQNLEKYNELLQKAKEIDKILYEFSV
jgi:galactokinase